MAASRKATTVSASNLGIVVLFSFFLSFFLSFFTLSFAEEQEEAKALLRRGVTRVYNSSIQPLGSRGKWLTSSFRLAWSK